jgi:16S rRNA processing protein RimM
LAPLDRDRLTRIGRIVGAHGLNGAVRVRPETDDPASYFADGQVYVDSEEGLRRFRVRNWTPGAEWIVTLDGLDSREAAERLKGGELLLDEIRLRPLAEGEYFQHDLPGCEVLDRQGRRLGSVAGIVEVGGQALLDVRDGPRALMLPMVEAVILSVDVQARRIVAQPPPGSLEVEE